MNVITELPDPNDSWAQVELYRWQHGHLPGDNSGERCLICNRPVPNYIAKYCCNGSDCGCLGQPLEPCVCSNECSLALHKGIGKPYDQRRLDAGIFVWNGEEKLLDEAAGFRAMAKAIEVGDKNNFPAPMNVMSVLIYAAKRITEARQQAFDEAIEAAKNCLHDPPTYQQDDLLSDVVSAITTARNNTKPI